MKLDRLHLTLGVLLALGIAFRAVRERSPARTQSVSTASALDRQIGEVSNRRKAGKPKPPPRPKGVARTALSIPKPEQGATLRVESTPAGARTLDPGDLRQGASVPPTQLLVNLDLASAAAIESLPRIGPALAQRIVADRAEHGSFGSLAGLDRVKGVGPALQKEIAPYVTFSPSGRPSTVAAVPSPAERSGRGKGRRRPPASAVR